ncbi:probable calcium-binding protein CML29 [Vitis riparia]|uniref:probable calcium-binding protein CML29 n=1 Tax=Vitis riparia TaxID=96939 RepID=UPI00155A4721|nr:probable calcium-binding protein CML29 [Vitis riparia]
MAQVPVSLSTETEALSHLMSLVEAFRAFDGDNDGLISAAELGGIMGSLGYNPSEHDVKTMMQQGDTNRDGLLSIVEFLKMNTQDMDLGVLGPFLKNAFTLLEAGVEEDDKVTGEELYGVIGDMEMELSLDDCQDIIAAMDGDGDGCASFEDFKLVVQSLL